MHDPATLTKDQLLEVLAEIEKCLARKDDAISQLEAKLEAKERAYLKLWQERFAAKSERYIADPDQLRIDFGDTAEQGSQLASWILVALGLVQIRKRSSHRYEKFLYRGSL